ncbi:LPD29 domain-containing protein, partial [Pseudomonas helleri]
MTTTAYIPTKDVAALIRQRLDAHFADVKFSVRTHQYAGGSHVNVSWHDGPATWQVDAVIGHFCGTTFDGMDDS